MIYCISCLLYNNDVNMHDERFGIELLYVAEAFLGVLMLVGISKKIKHNRVLQFIGTHFLVYFAFQGQLIRVIKVVLLKIGFTDVIVLCLLPAGVAAVILSMTVYIIYNYFPSIVGKGDLNMVTFFLKTRKK